MQIRPKHASYNAGKSKVYSWLKEFGHLSPIFFIERMPFKETRDYVKRILAKESIYNALLGKNLKINFS